MRKKTSAELQASIAKAFGIHDLARELTNQLVPENNKSRLLLAYCNIALEHQHSITLLVEQGDHDSSAHALYRPMLETVFRGLWVRWCATDDQVEQIRSGEFNFRGFEVMVGEVSDRVNATEPLGPTGEMRGVLNSWVHSGFSQLAAQFEPDGSIDSHDHPEALAPFVELVALTLLYLLPSTFRACGREDSAKRLFSYRSEVFGVI